jgi:outer membrane biosynthesis protein TonB
MQTRLPRKHNSALPLALLTGLLLLWAAPAAAQPQAPGGSSAFFHEGAQSYIGGEYEKAKKTVREGLQKYPDDPELLALRKKLKQQSKKRKKSGKKKQKKKQKKSKKKNRKKEKSNQQKKQKSGKKKKKQKSENGQKQKPQKNKQPPQQKKRTARKKKRRPKQISKKQALRILQALENQAKTLLREVQHPDEARRPVEKDW